MRYDTHRHHIRISEAAADGGVLLRIAILCAQVPIAPSATVGALLESVTKRATKKLGEIGSLYQRAVC